MQKIKPKPNSYRLFLTFFGVSALTIGGGYAMIPVFADKLNKKEWLEEKDFYDFFAAGQSFPGPMALNTAVLVGKHLCGIPGAIASFFGIMLPPFFAILLVSVLFSRLSDYAAVRGFLKASYGVVIGLVAAMLFKLLKARKWSPLALSLVGLGTIALILFKGLALPVFLAVVLIAYLGAAKWNF
ncbi:chromate transporter [Treponema sp.]